MLPRFSILALFAILLLPTGCLPAATSEQERAIPSVTQLPSPPPIPSPTPTPTAQFTLENAVAGLQDLSLEDFFEASFDRLQFRDPDLLIASSECYDIRHDQLTDISDAYRRDTQQLDIAILDLLHTYDRSALAPEQQLSYDIYEWYLGNLVRGHEFMYADFPINGYGSWDLANRLIDTTLSHPIETKQDAEDYISRLSQTGVWVDQLLEGLRLREQAGIIPPRFLIGDALMQIEGHMQLQSSGVFDVEAIELLVSFNAKLDVADSINELEKQAFRQSARTEIEQTFIPAFTKLREYLIYLQSIALEDAGLLRLPNGEAYYAYLLRRYTGTDLSAEELHQKGLAQVARLQAEMQQAAVDLGYPANLGMADINLILDENSSTLDGEALMTEYERLLAEAKGAADDFFGIFPSTDVVITYDPSAPVPGYYQPSSLDGSGLGQMIVNLQNPGASTLYNETVLTHHETIPGHYVQQALALDLNLPTFRTTLCSDVYLKDIEYQGYTEGWAVYAQQLGWEMGLYGEDQMENLGRLRLMLNQVARMVVETGIHANGWSREEAAAYFEQATGRPTTARQMNRYVALPGQAVSYDFGSITILELRQQAMDQLGNRFDIKEFHDVILGNGPMPAGFLERVVNDWIQSKLDQ